MTISIHALREEGDAPLCSGLECLYQFLSTPSARRATWHRRRTAMSDVFLSTPSARRATCGMPYGTQPETISIHALREEGDRMPSTSFSRSSDFYPRPPRGGRLYRIPWTVWRSIFLSTPSARRATSTSSPRGTSRNDFYPRPPRGGRPRTRSSSWSITNFYPRPPRGGRPLCASALA